jgi:hypothetical protein
VRKGEPNSQRVEGKDADKKNADNQEGERERRRGKKVTNKK